MTRDALAFVEKPKNILMPNQQWITGSLDPKLYARELYANLHALDKIPTTCIFVEEPPNTAAWVAIKDRLQRASHPTI